MLTTMYHYVYKQWILCLATIHCFHVMCVRCPIWLEIPIEKDVTCCDVCDMLCCLFCFLPLIFLKIFSLSLKSFGFNSCFFIEWRNLYPFFFNKFLKVSSQTLLSSPETSHNPLIAIDLNCSLNLCISHKIIIFSLKDTFFGLSLLNLRLSTTCVKSIDLTACRYRLVLEYSM